MKATLTATTTDLAVVEAIVACWSSRADGAIHTAAAGQSSGWKLPTMTAVNDDGSYAFADSGVQPAFDPATYWRHETESEGSEDEGAVADAQHIENANGTFAYGAEWNDIERAARPAVAAARLLHLARQRTGTSRWWTMRWPPDAVSILGRPCGLNTGRRYDLVRALRKLSAMYLQKLWQITVERRRDRGDSAARGVVRAEWGETKRRLGTTGRNGKKQLMPVWSTVSTQPLYKIKRLLSGWNRVANATVLRGGQRTLRGFVTVRAKGSSNTRDSAGGDDAAPTPAVDSAVTATNLRRQTPPVGGANTATGPLYRGGGDGGHGFPSSSAWQTDNKRG